MPSTKRPSPRDAMDDGETDADADAAVLSLPASPPRSRKRSKSSSRRRSRSRSRNPNPKPRPDLYGSEPSRKSSRKRKPRAFPDSAFLSQAIVAARPLAASSPPRSRSRGHNGGGLWTNADEVALLTGAVAFRAGSGRAPRSQDTDSLFESIRDSLSLHIDRDKVYYKLKRLKSKFCHTALQPTSTPHERRVRELSADLWGRDLAPLPAAQEAAMVAEYSEEEEEEEEEDADDGYTGTLDVPVGPRLPLVSEMLGEYWRRNARALSGVSLEKGLALVGAERGREAEATWRRQLDAEMRTQVRRHDLAKEVFGMLIDTVKGLGP